MQWNCCSTTTHLQRSQSNESLLRRGRKDGVFALPKIIGRLGHTHILTLKFDGGNGDSSAWDTLIRNRVVPRVFGVATKTPDKILVVCDREGRDECPPTLAKAASAIIDSALKQQNISADVAVVVCDRKFENLLMADTVQVDKFTFMKAKFSESIGGEVDGKNVERHFNNCCRAPYKYDKVLHGAALAQKMNLSCSTVQQRSRSLRKLLKELDTSNSATPDESLDQVDGTIHITAS